MKFKDIMLIRDPVNDNWSVLHYISKMGYVSVMNYLVCTHKRTNINVLSNKGQTPLHIAIDNLNINMIKFLIHNGASLQVCDHHGNTPFEMLSYQNLGYLSQPSLPENSGSTIPSTVSSSGNKGKYKVRQINIFDVNEDNVDSMFHNVREYFDNKLQVSRNKRS